MLTKKSLVVFGVALLSLISSGSSICAQEWEKMTDNRFQKEDDVEGTAEIWARPVKKLGRDMLEFRIKVTTKTIGRNRTGRAYATYAVVDSTGKAIITLQAEKYASTSAIQREHEEDSEATAMVSADAFWNKFDSDVCQAALTVRTTAKVDFPLTSNDGVKWFKDNVSPEIAGAIDQLKKKAAGERIGQENWTVWNMKKGSLK